MLEPLAKRPLELVDGQRSTPQPLGPGRLIERPFEIALCQAAQAERALTETQQIAGQEGVELHPIEGDAHGGQGALERLGVIAALHHTGVGQQGRQVGGQLSGGGLVEQPRLDRGAEIEMPGAIAANREAQADQRCAPQCRV